MITGRVCRGSSFVDECRDEDGNLKWGNDITDSLIVTDAVLRERGRVEIDKVYTNRKFVDISMNHLSFTQPGSMLSIVEGTVQNNGMLKSINITFNTGKNLVVGSAMRIERSV